MAEKCNTESLLVDVHCDALVAQDEDDATYPEQDAPLSQDLDWEEGTEEHRHHSVNTLWTLLARETHYLPLFKCFMDHTGLHNPWDHPAFFSNPLSNPDIRRLSPRWYQLIGILKGIELAFDGKPLLLMDGVGFGKTLQLTGMFVMLKWFRDYYAEHGDFPGKFSECFPLFKAD